MEQPSGAERRRHVRLAIENVPAALLVGGYDLGLHTIVDASESGVFVCHPSPVVPAGTPVALVLPSTTGRPPITLAGRIAHVRPSGGTRPGYGVEWVSPPVDLLERIIELHTARGGPPARVPPPLHPPPQLHTPPPVGQVHHPLARTDDVEEEVARRAGPAAPEPCMIPPERLRAMVIDHDAVHARSVARVLGAIGLPASHDTRARGALERFETCRQHVVLVLVDLLLPDVSGEELIRKLRRDKPSLKIVATTDVLRTASSQRPLLRAGADRVLPKPFDAESLGIMVRAMVAT